MGKKNDSKQTAKTVTAVKQLLGGFSKEQIAQIQKELEEGGSDEEPSSLTPTIPDDYWYLPAANESPTFYEEEGKKLYSSGATWTIKPITSNIYYTNSKASFVTADQWLPLTNPQRREIEEDVQDVDFSEE